MNDRHCPCAAASTAPMSRLPIPVCISPIGGQHGKYIPARGWVYAHVAWAAHTGHAYRHAHAYVLMTASENAALMPPHVLLGNSSDAGGPYLPGVCICPMGYGNAITERAQRIRICPMAAHPSMTESSRAVPGSAVAAPAAACDAHSDTHKTDYGTHIDTRAGAFGHAQNRPRKGICARPTTEMAIDIPPRARG